MKKIYLEEELTEAYQHLINVNEILKRKDLMEWFIFHNIDSKNMNELDMYIYYIKVNSEKTLIPQKYVGSTLNGELITSIKIDCEGIVTIVTEKFENVFNNVDVNYEYAYADSILCDLQDEKGINVSKY